MLFPNIRSRVEQRCHLSRILVDCSEVRPLAGIATIASQSEIREFIPAAVLARHDVLGVEWKKWRGRLRKMAILTMLACPLTYSFAGGGIH